MLDIVSSFISAMAWTGALVCWWLFHLRSDGSWTVLQRYFGLKLLGWTLLMLANTSYFIALAQTEPYSWSRWILTDQGQAVRLLVFWPVQGLAIWWLIYDIVRPRVTVAGATETAQIIMDEQGLIRGWNRAAERLLGWTAQEALGQELAGLIIPEDIMVTLPAGEKVSAREAHRLGLARFRATGDAPVLDARYPMTTLRKDLAPLSIHIHVSKHKTLGGQAQFLGVITPRAPWEA